MPFVEFVLRMKAAAMRQLWLITAISHGMSGDDRTQTYLAMLRGDADA
jgi:hypothetical protein